MGGGRGGGLTPAHLTSLHPGVNQRHIKPSSSNYTNGMPSSHASGPIKRLYPPERRHGSILEYQAMSSLLDVAHGGWLCTFTIKQQLEIPSARIPPVRTTGTVRKRQAVRPVNHTQIHTCRITFLQSARRAAVLDQPSSLRHHWFPPS
jgi:hypothetical protein